jgi:hypothetical protein
MPLDSQFRAILDALERAGALPLVRGMQYRPVPTTGSWCSAAAERTSCPSR